MEAKDVMKFLAYKKIDSLDELKKILSKIKRAKIKDNFGEILRTMTYGYDYNEDIDKEFIEKYAGKEVNVYQWAGDWWICEDDNYVITEDCFDLCSKN
jgi:hypothetical protein